MIDIAKKSVELIHNINKNGFNGVGIENYEYESVWNKHYAIFVITFDTYFESDNEYNRFDLDLFEHDFLVYLKELFPKCKVTYQGSCHEVEIVGPNYDKWYRKNADRLEKFENDNWEANKIIRKKEPVIFL